MFLFIVLAVIQSTLVIPIMLIVANYWENEKLEGVGARQTLLNFICGMSAFESLAWVGSEFGLTSLMGGLSTGLEVLGTTLALNIIFLLSILLAVFSEIRMRERKNLG